MDGVMVIFIILTLKWMHTHILANLPTPHRHDLHIATPLPLIAPAHNRPNGGDQGTSLGRLRGSRKLGLILFLFFSFLRKHANNCHKCKKSDIFRDRFFPWNKMLGWYFLLCYKNSTLAWGETGCNRWCKTFVLLIIIVELVERELLFYFQKTTASKKIWSKLMKLNIKVRI
jgi:hypothetical protein